MDFLLPIQLSGIKNVMPLDTLLSHQNAVDGPNFRPFRSSLVKSLSVSTQTSHFPSPKPIFTFTVHLEFPTNEGSFRRPQQPRYPTLLSSRSVPRWSKGGYYLRQCGQKRYSILNQVIAMTQRHFSPQELGGASHSLQKDGQRKLREAGSLGSLHLGKTTSVFSEDSETIGPFTYRRKDEIGSGYTSHVYRCRSSKDDNDYAVKVIELKKYSSSSLEMLDNEIDILKRLTHPNILKFENVYRTATHCYLITEYCPHGDLLEYITKHGKLCEKEAVTIISEVVEAVKYLFRMGVVHRDVKPANIFKGAKNWKLGDFGFAINATIETKTRHNVGTPLYMPLESLLKNSYSPESDIFAVGVILYEMIVGITPWECKSEKELIRKMSSTPFAVPEKYKITPSIRFLLAKMCAVNREERMTREEFLEINIQNFVSLINFNETGRSDEQKRKPRVYSVGKTEKKEKGVKGSELEYQMGRKKSGNDLKSTPKVELRKTSKNKVIDVKGYVSTSRKSSHSNSSERKFQSKLQHKNYEVLVSQLNFCRFMYYLIENSHYLQLNSLNRGRLSLLLFKHVLKVIKQLADNKNNWFGFTNWDSFRKNPKYDNTYKTLREYCEKYEKEYLVFLKKAEINVIKEINQKLPEFATNEQFSIAFYRKILTFLSPLLRECNQNLSTVPQQVREGRGEEGVAKLQALRSLYKYYRLVEMSIREYQNYTHFSVYSNITILKNYRQSQMGVNDFLQIRQEIKMI